MHMPIYVDLDDVLCDMTRGLVAALHQRYHKSVSYESIWSFDLGRSFSLSPDDLAAFMSSAHTRDALLSLPPVNGAIDVLSNWAASGESVHIVTGRPTGCRDASLEWLDLHRVPFSRLLFVDKYRRESKDLPFRALALETLIGGEYAFAVEDSAEMALWLSQEAAIPVILMDRPWNRENALNATSNTLVTRCRDWDEVRRTATILARPC